MKMNEALYKRKDIEEIIKAENINKRIYHEKYKEFLFCPVEGCNAKLALIERKNHVKFFRTFPSTPHKDGCPNAVEYDDTNAKDKTRINDGKINLSTKHINNTIDRAIDNYISKIKNIDRNGGKKNNPGKSHHKISDGFVSKGSPELFGDGIDVENGREPYIPTRIYDELDENDDGKIRCVLGYVNNMQVMERHGYINLTPKSSHSVKVHFAEYFVIHNESEFNHMDVINNYIKLMKSYKKNVLCCCIGRIRFVDTGINIILDRHEGFKLDGMGFYQILSYMNDGKNMVI